MAVVQLLRLRHLALWFPLEAVDSYGSVVRNLEEHISVPRWVGEGVVEGSPPTSQVPVEKLVESHMVIVVHQNARVSATNLMLHPRITGNSKVITSVWLNKDMKPTLIQSIKKKINNLFCLRLCSEKCSIKIKNTHRGRLVETEFYTGRTSTPRNWGHHGPRSNSMGPMMIAFSEGGCYSSWLQKIRMWYMILIIWLYVFVVLIIFEKYQRMGLLMSSVYNVPFPLVITQKKSIGTGW